MAKNHAPQAAPEAEQAPAPAATPTRLLRGPDGFVYVFTEALAAMDGFTPYEGDVDASGFAVQK